MILYLLYRFGVMLALVLPLEVSYAIARVIAALIYAVSSKDRIAVEANIKVVYGSVIEKSSLDATTRAVFRNFAKYLADFFRFSKIDDAYINDHVRVEGRENVDAALGRGRGVILLSAHIGNWELGAAAVSMIGYPLHAVTLVHQNKRVNEFFARQRMTGRVTPIEVGMSIKNCYTVLKENGLLAMLGDRDFSRTGGLYIKFFGRETNIPKGPAALSKRLGAAIVPCFMLREENDDFKLIFEKPILPKDGPDEDAAISEIAMEYLSVLEKYIRQYPYQWYVFRKVWNNNHEDMRPNTIV